MNEFNGEVEIYIRLIGFDKRNWIWIKGSELRII